MLKQQSKLLFYLFLTSLFCLESRSKKVGDPCQLPVTRDPGVCKLSSDCPSAIELHRAKRIKPEYCGIERKQPIYCCKIDQPVVRKPQRKCEEKCAEYNKQIVRLVYPDNSNKQSPQCDYDRVSLILNGVDASLGEFPHMALLGYSPSNTKEIQWNCGGTIISELYILTAAHCLYDRTVGNVTFVRIAELNLALKEKDSEPEDVEVASYLKFPGYKRKPMANDIALIRLARPIQFNKYKRPACLWTSTEINQNTAIATGWGSTYSEGPKSNALQKVGLDIIENAECNTHYQSALFKSDLPNGILPTMLCAINATGQGDTCRGDSGGPLQILTNNNPCLYYIIGVTSTGRSCGSDTASIYTRVSEYIDWIESVVWS